LLWSLTQALLSPADVLIVSAASPAEAVRLFREGRVDAAAGTVTDLAATARDRGGRIIASTADSPHLIATVLVVRSDLLARFPDAVRRLTRAVLDSSEGMAQEQTDAARLLSASAPQLGDPFEALHLDAPATRAENLAFFGIEGDTPVRYDELFTSAAALWRKLGEKADNGLPADSRELGPLIAAGGKSAAPSTGTALGPRPSP
jgi:ABC-type nitrate/sulfonate/bicarbonate transport system substrate-binding protein